MKINALTRIAGVVLLAASVALGAEASEKGKLEKINEKSAKRIEKVQKKANKRLEKIRERANKRIAKIMERAWGRNIPAEVPHPVRIDPVPPTPPVNPEPLPDPIDREIVVEPIEEPVIDPNPEPTPIVPEEDRIKEQEEQREQEITPAPEPVRTNITIYGRTYPVAVVGDFCLLNFEPSTVARAWSNCSSDDNYDTLASDVLRATKEGKLTGWAALEFTDKVASAMMTDPSSRAFLQTWLLVQLGYDARLGNAGGKLYTMFGTNQMPMCNPERSFMYAVKDGRRYVFYSADAPSGQFYMHDSLGSSLKPIDLFITSLPATAGDSRTRHLETSDYPEVDITTYTADTGLLDYFSRYPRFSYDNGGVVAQWLNYATTPFENRVKNQLEEPLRKAVAGKNELDAVNLILSTVQDAFPYGYDDEIWGGDRPFFPQETLYYEKCDCEDHAILFTRLIKDILGLPCALVYYPGHLAAAVEFSQPVTGDYIMLNGHRMTICDPTYYRPAGYTMPGMDNSTAQALRF